MIARPKSTRFETTALVCLALGAGLAASSCGEREADAPATARTAALTASPPDGATGPGDLDVLFMIDNSSLMVGIQQKLTAQIPQFVTALENLPTGLPNIHIAVISSDMGAVSDVNIGCTAQGDNGTFHSAPEGSCTDTTLVSGASFISNVGGVLNYTGNLSDVLTCIAPLGQFGCGFEHQLASVARALGADGSPAPATNAGFLRPNAQLAIVLLSNEDDCSAPANTSLYSLNGYSQNISSPLGPVAKYRCNAFGHLCVDPASSLSCLIEPPDHVPADAQGSPPTLNLTDCESADGTGLLTSVQSFIQGIRSLKYDPDNQIVVGAIVAPTTPYTVSWQPETGGENTSPGELWPEVEHSCGPAGGNDINPLATQNPLDGSLGDPAIRITQFVKAFGDNGIVGSVCDATYASTITTIVDKIGQHLAGATSTDGGTGGGTGAALPVCANGLNMGLGPDAGSGGSGSNTGCGTGGILGGAGGVPGGTGGSPVDTGLHGGGCDLGASRPGAWALAGLGLLLVLARRRRARAR